MIDVSVNHLLLHMESNNFILSIIRFYNEKIKQHMRALCLNSVKSMKARILQTNFMKTVVYWVIKIPNNHGLRMVPYILPYKVKMCFQGFTEANKPQGYKFPAIFTQVCWKQTTRECLIARRDFDFQGQSSLEVINFLQCYNKKYHWGYNEKQVAFKMLY